MSVKDLALIADQILMQWTLQYLRNLGLLAWLLGAAVPTRAEAYTANKVWFEVRESGRFRVNVTYTVPALKEFRESWVEFRSRKLAEAFYWNLVRGADFYPGDSATHKFSPPKLQPQPW